jgi:quinohemoprotein ethanol dehydrogenase
MRRLLVFSLEGKATVPPQPPPYLPKPIVDKGFIIDESKAELGRKTYGMCSGCHGANAIAKGMAPDLRASAIPLSSEAFVSVVREGMKADMGMPAFSDLSEDELEGLRHFLRKRAHEDGSNSSITKAPSEETGPR